jgi:hypothetical protein
VVRSISVAGATRMGRTISMKTAPGGESVCITTRRGIGLMIGVIQSLDAGWGQIINTMKEAAPNAPQRWSPYQGPVYLVF